MNKLAYGYAIFLLSKREYSSHRLKQKIQEKHSLAQEELEEIVRILEEQNYLNEDRFVLSFIRYYFKKGFSPMAISQKLREQRISRSSPEIKESILEQFQKEEIEWVGDDVAYEPVVNRQLEKRKDSLSKTQYYVQSRGYRLRDFSSWKKREERGD